MITIHGCYRSRASRPLWLLEEMGVPFTCIPVVQAYRLADPLAADAPINTKSPAFLALNPTGRIPAMVDGALVLNESLAMCLYLAKAHGGALGPKDLAEDGRMTAWALWAAGEVEIHSIQVLYNTIGKPPAERDAALLARSVEALRAPFAVLDAALAETGFAVGGRFTVADVILAEVCRYALPAPELFAAAPRVDAWIKACHARPGYRRMMAARDAEPA